MTTQRDGEELGKLGSAPAAGLARDSSVTVIDIEYLYNINIINKLSIQYIDSLRWTDEIGHPYRSSRTVANSRITPERDTKGEPR
jgi:hypothetical protein